MYTRKALIRLAQSRERKQRKIRALLCLARAVIPLMCAINENFESIVTPRSLTAVAAEIWESPILKDYVLTRVISTRC